MMRRCLTTLSVLVMLLAFTGPAFAQTVLFGPKQYQRTAGPPNTYTDTFTLPSGTTAPYTLHIVNGNANGTNRVSSATITLSGTQIVGPSDFGQNVAVIDRTVTLQATNTLTVLLTSAPGSFLTVSVLDTSAGAQPTALTPNPLNLNAGVTGTLTATLAPAPTAAGTLAVSSANTAVATVPAAVSFASGQTSVPITVTAVASGSTTVTVTLNGGSAASQVTVAPPPPTITSFTPTSGRVGDTVTITGTNFINVQSVTFNGVAAIFTINNATTMTAVVPSGATTGKIAVSDSAGTAQSATDFLVLPTITQFTPTTSKLGTFVTISGTGYHSTPSSNQVTIGGVTAPVQSAMSTQLVVKVPVGALSGVIRVTTSGGTTQSLTAFTVVGITSVTVSPIQASLPIGANQAFRGTAHFADQTTLDVTSLMAWSSSNTSTISITAGGVGQGLAIGTATITGTLGSLTGTANLQVVSNAGIGALPPDPATMAPPLNRTVATPFAPSTAFLYSGANPIQTGVVPGTIVAKRAAVLRGVVKGRDGWPLPGVTVRVLNHPELGQTLTRTDGMFDLAVNGGGLLTVDYQKSGYLPAQRSIQVPWQDYVYAPDTVLITLDPQATAINLAAATTVQIAEGTPQTDASGTRQARVFFMPGTTATMVMPNGTTQPLSAMSARATEYTVGPTGPQAMPAVLPPASGYTYAVELSVDEAMAAGAVSVQFNQPVHVYLENFLNLPAGTQVPVGIYERTKGSWVPSPDGRIVAIISVSSGIADIDTDGDGAADNTGITLEERQAVALKYVPGQLLWRAGLTHFTPCDLNFPLLPEPPDAAPPVVEEPKTDEPEDDSCETGGSIIGCENQTLGQQLPITGTPYRLHYQGAYQKGRLAGNELTIPLSGANLPTGVQRIDLGITIAGQVFNQTFPPLPNQQFVFQWDGKDVYGRTLQGKYPSTISRQYIYNAVIIRPLPGSITFGISGDVSFNPPIGSRIQVPKGVRTIKSKCFPG